MSAFFAFLEQLVTLSPPSIVALQSIFGITLMQTSQSNTSWQFYEAHPASGLVAAVDYREPNLGATRQKPFLVLELRGTPVHLSDLMQRYGEPKITDVSHHHPWFTGYSFIVKGREVGFDVDSKTDAVLSVGIDYSSTAP